MRELAGETHDGALTTESMWLSAGELGGQAYVPDLGNAFPVLRMRMWQEGKQNGLDARRKTKLLVNAIREQMSAARPTQLAVYAMASLRGIMDA